MWHCLCSFAQAEEAKPAPSSGEVSAGAMGLCFCACGKAQSDGCECSNCLCWGLGGSVFGALLCLRDGALVVVSNAASCLATFLLLHPHTLHCTPYKLGSTAGCTTLACSIDLAALKCALCRVAARQLVLRCFVVATMHDMRNGIIHCSQALAITVPFQQLPWRSQPPLFPGLQFTPPHPPFTPT